MKIGFWELIVIVIVAFVFIGPDQLPVYAKKIGKMLRELKKYTGAASEDAVLSLPVAVVFLRGLPEDGT